MSVNDLEKRDKIRCKMFLNDGSDIYLYKTIVMMVEVIDFLVMNAKKVIIFRYHNHLPFAAPSIGALAN